MTLPKRVDRLERTRKAQDARFTARGTNMTHKENWIRFFELALERYRQETPHDDRSDSQILFSMLETFYNDGIADKNDAGQYTLPRIENPDLLWRRMSSHRN